MLAEQLADILEQARPVLLMPNSVCIDRVDVQRLVARIGSDEADLPGFGRVDPQPDAALSRALRAVEKAVRRGYDVPFTDQVRLPRRRVAELAAALRAALAA